MWNDYSQNISKILIKWWSSFSFFLLRPCFLPWSTPLFITIQLWSLTSFLLFWPLAKWLSVALPFSIPQLDLIWLLSFCIHVKTLNLADIFLNSQAFAFNLLLYNYQLSTLILQLPPLCIDLQLFVWRDNLYFRTISLVLTIILIQTLSFNPVARYYWRSF